ncbi:NAD(P)H-dependent flavin oxidoreductase [Antrihabitans stalactiti]|uniref:Nitronate monooxygenase n=1 Tax=Antrihabitans stalactiti TaxID=2584121 RepID=A0A848KGR6_9NOCA|nr:nitronate monooxygenase [Antrihabitans stalactiti]NMN95902.1 nitronate monooxygenase [Antrihabitans stalactiti]
MHTPLCELFGIDHPIFGFSPSPPVVAAISNAGGMGVLGVAAMTPEGVDEALSWIEDQVGERPYGVDVIMPALTAETAAVDTEQLAAELRARIPNENREFVDDLMDRFALEPIPDDNMTPGGMLTHLAARSQLDTVLQHSPAFLVNALGTLPADIIETCRQRGIRTGSLAGKAKHAVAHRDAGIDVVISTSYEAAGHTGDIAGMVLHAEIANAVAPLPVLASGAMATGRQAAAAIALGAQGVWAGSAWLTSDEWIGRPPPTAMFPGWTDAKQAYLDATSSDTVRTRWATGKPARLLRTPWSDAWEASDSPGYLPMPLQGALVTEAQRRMGHWNRSDIGFMPAGQVIGMLNEIKPAGRIIAEMVREYDEVVASLANTTTGPR